MEDCIIETENIGIHNRLDIDNFYFLDGVKLSENLFFLYFEKNFSFFDFDCLKEEPYPIIFHINKN